MSAAGNATCAITNEKTVFGNWTLIQLVHLVCIIFVPLTISLNMIVIVKINAKRKHKFFTRFLLSSLAVVDMCVGFVVMPFMIANTFYDVTNLLGTHTCSIIFSLDVFFSSASIIHLSLLTYERFIAIRKPFAYYTYCGIKVLITLYFLGWVLVTLASFGIVMPGFNQLGINEDILECLKDYADGCVFIANNYYAVFCSIVTLFLPAVLITVFNIGLFCTIRRNIAERKQSLNVRCIGNNRASTQSIRVARTIAVLTGCFFMCWLPFIVVNLLHSFQRGREPIEFVIASWLALLNSAMNPSLYLLLETRSCIGRR